MLWTEQMVLNDSPLGLPVVGRKIVERRYLKATDTKGLLLQLFSSRTLPYLSYFPFPS